MKNYFYLFCSLFLIACEKEEIKPRTNPQFSVAFIQDIDETGVEFAANIYDYGSDEILEYGFVYDGTSTPRVEYSETLKQEGMPDTFFSMKAVHTLIKGKRYNVAAYIKTKKRTVYSAMLPFTSEGSTGFIYEKIDMPEPLYFGDTVTVWGSNMSRDPSFYQFQIQGVAAKVIEVNERNFKVILPALFDFPADDFPLNIEVRVVDKIFKITQKVEFKSPIFIIEPTNFDYVDTLTIRGELLDSKEVLLQYVDANSSHNIIPISVSGEKVVFKPKVRFTSLEPKFILTIRGKSYSFNNFKINPTELIAGQEFNQSHNSTVSIEVNNPNPYYPDIHSLYLPGAEDKLLYPSKVDKNFISYKLNQYVDVIYPRRYNLGMITYNYKSKENIAVNLTDAAVKFLRAPLFNPYGRSISYKGKGYIFVFSDILVMDPVVKKVEKLISLYPNSYHSLSYLFLKIHPSGKMYMGGFDRDGNDFAVMRSFDPHTNTVEFLGRIPAKFQLPRAVYITDRYLYYEGTSYYTNEHVDERYRYDLQTGEWQLLNETNSFHNDRSDWYTFSYESKLYSFRREPSTGNHQLQLFDPSTERWLVLYTYPYTGIIMEIFTWGDYVFYNDGSGKYRVNMRNWKREKVTNIAPIFTNLMSFQSGNKIYHYTYPFFYEYDPEFFTY